MVHAKPELQQENDRTKSAESDSSDSLGLVTALSGDDAMSFAGQILTKLITFAGAAASRAYFLNFASGEYLSYPRTQPVTLTDAIGASTSVDMIPSILKTLLRGTPLPIGLDLFLPVLRNKTCLAVVHLEYSEERNQTSDEIDNYLSYAQSLTFVYSMRFAETLLESLKEPVEYEDASPEDYYDNLISAVSLAAGLDRVVLRRLEEDGGLTCIAKAGFDGRDNAELSFPANRLPSPFQRAIDEQTVISVPNARAIDELRSDTLYDNVSSFVVIPVRVGERVFGTMSLATGDIYEFSQFELVGLEAIANGAGVAITNFDNYREAQAQIDDLSDIAVSASAIDVSQAVRHETLGYINRAQTRLAEILRRPKQTIGAAHEPIESLSSIIDLIRQAIDKIKLATKPPEKELKECYIDEVWALTCDLLRGGRLDPLGIEPRYQGKRIKIFVYPDWLRTTFFNLIINSYDAYKRGPSSHDRKVLLKVVSSSEDNVTLEYTDQAGGIEMNKLRVPWKLQRGSIRDLDLNDVLFLPGVSSKRREGSGYGLYLARKGIQIHKGASLDLRPSKKGVRFRIVLPTKLAASSKPII